MMHGQKNIKLWRP